MSADQWSKCPRCLRKAEDAIIRQQEELDDAYGKVSLREFDALRAQLEQARIKLLNFEPTWREDFSFQDAASGTLKVGYLGACTKCKLKLEFEEEREIPGWQT